MQGKLFLPLPYITPLSVVKSSLSIIYCFEKAGPVQRRRWHPIPVFLPGKSHGRKSLVGYSPWGLEESETTEWLHFHFSLSCIGEGNGNPLQCSCLAEPGGLSSMGSHRVGHDWATSLSLFTFTHWRRKWHPTPVFLPGESQGWQSLVGCCLWGLTESDTTEAT